MTTTRWYRLTLAALVAATFVAFPVASRAQTPVRVRDLVRHSGDIARRLVGYGIVVGLDGTGDRSFGGSRGETPTVRSIVNLLRRFHIEVPPDRLRPRDVAAVVVTAEVSPYLKAGGRFEVQVGAIGDAMSLRGGQLWITPLVTDPNEDPIATAQGALLVSGDASRGVMSTRANAGHIPDGGLLELDQPAAAALDTRLQLREANLATAANIAKAVNAAFGAGTAKVEDPGTVSLRPSVGAAADPLLFLAAVDTTLVVSPERASIVIDARDGTVVAGGDVRVGPASVSHHGVTLEIGKAAGRTAEGLVRVEAPATIQDVAAGLHAAGLRPEEIAAVFQSLRAAGAVQAEVLVR